MLPPTIKVAKAKGKKVTQISQTIKDSPKNQAKNIIKYIRNNLIK